MTINSSFRLSLRESQTIPDKLKKRSIKELDAGIFNKMICKSNNFGISDRCLSQKSIVDMSEFVKFLFPKIAEKKMISASSSLSRL